MSRADYVSRFASKHRPLLASEVAPRMVCPCVFCEADRERNAPTFVIRWADDGLYYHPRSADRFSVARQVYAMRFGPRHTRTFCPAFVKVRLKAKRQR